MYDHMFQLPIPLLEKIIRPIIVYLALIALLRIFGKRELAQLNPFDLVVLLSLSNTVQNALIGDDIIPLVGVLPDRRLHKRELRKVLPNFFA